MLERFKQLGEAIQYKRQCGKNLDRAYNYIAMTAIVSEDADYRICIKYYIDMGTWEKCKNINCCKTEACAYFTEKQEYDRLEREYKVAKKQVHESIKNLFRIKSK